MDALQKPKTVTITLADRKVGKYKSFVVYGKNLEDIESKIKETFSQSPKEQKEGKRN